MAFSGFHEFQAGTCMQVTGPDAASFLQGQFSNDLSQLSEGGVVYGLWLDRKGKILADSFVLKRGDEAFLVVSVHCGECIVYDRLDAYLIMEEVELGRASKDAGGVCVFGDEAQAAACAAIGVELPLEGRFVGVAGLVGFWGRRGGELGLEFVAIGVGGIECIGKIGTALRGRGINHLSGEDMAGLAIAGKVPQIGLGFGESDLPQELGLERDAVSFKKGCYLGQEVMARLHAMGRVRKRLARFSISGADTIALGDLPLDLFDEAGKRYGQLRLIAYPESGGVGLGVVNSGFGGGGLLAGAGRARLVEMEKAGNG